MEFSETQIARLILGYLKSKHYMSTFNKFLEECHHFEKIKQHIRSGEHYPTRVGGMSLVEFLEEYANLYTIVQARLEDTDYFNGEKRRSSLGIIDQLLYLLNTRTLHVSTPASSVCSSEVEATSYDALPGNCQDTDSNHLIHKITPKRKFLKTHSRSFNDNNIDPAEVSEVLTQHLLDKTEFHVKLANTINIVRNSPEIINRQQQQQQPQQQQEQQQQQQQSQQQSNEEIDAGASKELEILIKSVVEKTEEDPIYNELIDEIMGIPTTDSTSSHKKTSISDSNTDDQWAIRRKQRSKLLNYSEIIETQNDDAIRGIIAAASSSASSSSSAASQSLETPTTTTTTVIAAAAATTTTNSGIYIYDGNLDCYLKNNATTTMLNQNKFFIGTPGILVVPQINQCDIINTEQNQQINNKILTDNDIMAMPTIIINEEVEGVPPPVATTSVSMVPLENNQDCDENKNEEIDKNIPIKTKSEIVKLKNNKTTIETEIIKNTDNRSNNPPRHVRNLDFSTPSTKLIELPLCGSISITPDVTTVTTTTTTTVGTNTTTTVSINTKKSSLSKAWDADLRLMIYGENEMKIEESQPRKRKTRKKSNSRNTKVKDGEDGDQVKDENLEDKPVTPTNEQPEQQQQQLDNKNETVIVLDTPTKDCIPKTPGVGESLTPFSQVIEEQLHGIDIMSFPTPKVPVTPGFGLTTPLDTNYKQRNTDYSTSSSYYIPSDNEQNNKSIEKAIIEEAKKPTTKVNIISDVVIDKQTTKTTTTTEIVTTTTTTTTTQSCNETLENFNHSIVGKKDLKLIKLSDVSSGSLSNSSSSSDNEQDDTVLCCKNKESKLEKSGEEIISDIIKKVDVQETLLDDDDDKNTKKQLLKNLEEKRRRTIERIQKSIDKKPIRNQTKLKTSILPTRKRLTKKCDQNIVKRDDNKNKIKQQSDDDRNKNGSVDDEDEAKKLVQGLWERGICLVPKKPQIKPLPQSDEIKSLEPPPPQQENTEISSFQRYSCSEMIEITHQDGFVAKKLNQYDLKRLDKKMEASVYIDDDDTPVTRNMECIPFVKLLDIPSIQKRNRRNVNVGKPTSSSSSSVSPVKNFRALSPDEDKLMDCVAIGKITGISPELKTKTPRKRKLKTMENDKGIEKKSRKHENSIKLLRDINVDDFLDKVHNS